MGYGMGAVAEGFQQGQRDEEQYGLKKRGQELSLENLEQSSEFQNSQREQRRALGAFVASDGQDTASLTEWWNKQMPGAGIQDFTKNEDGSYTVTTANNKPINFKNKVEVAKATEAVMQPENWLNLQNEKPVAISPGAQLVRPSTGELVAENKNRRGGEASMFGKVQLQNGQVVSEADLRGEYGKQFQTVDKFGNTITNPDAPAFDQWRNSVVAPSFARGATQPEEPPGFGLPGRETMRQAEKEERDKMGAKDWIPFVEPDQEAIRKRAQEIEFGAPSSNAAGAQKQVDEKLDAKDGGEQIPSAVKKRLEKLKPGKGLKLKNGQVWAWKDGKPVRVK